ncbi:hypothetical protein [Aquimarina longa]|uniref:hypothetical protein n=1 Tax=Aquimarina longa TaxID=1080221 RepID=UPI0007821B5E|nr:hypothetical protein [Aquimarina longa]
MIIKLHIAKFLILLGFFLSLTNYAIELIAFYNEGEHVIAISFEDTEENTNPLEKENSEKEGYKENDKISQYYIDEIAAVAKLSSNHYPEFYIQNSSVFLEYTTPPPEIV